MKTGKRAADGGPFVGLKRHLRGVVVPGEAAYLLSVRGVTALRGRHAEVLVPLLDGTRTLPQLLEEAARTIPAGEAGRVVARLAHAKLIGYQEAVDGSEGSSARAYWDLAGLDGEGAARELARTPVAVLTVGRVDPDETRAACEASGLAVTAAEDRAAAFSLVFCDDYLADRLGEIAAGHRAAGRPWMPARLCGAEPWIGPVFRPDDGPCWSCMAHRLRGHRQAELLVRRTGGTAGPTLPPPASLAAGHALGLQAAVLEAAKWLAGLRHEAQAAVRTLDTLSLTSRLHPVSRRPQCPECGNPALVADQVRRPVIPRSRAKATHGGSNDRALTPSQVRDRYRHLISPLTGIVTEVRRDTRLPGALNCFVSGANPATQAHSLGALRGGLRSVSGGKGVTAVEAQVGALCEAAERFSATRQGDEPVIRDTLRGLGDQAVHPNDCQLFDERQFRDRARWNATHSAFQQVCAPLAPDRPVDWTPVWSLTAGTHRLLPTSMLYFGAGHPQDDPLGPWADSNGNAAGSSLEDAIVQGFLELVERDAVAMWWYNRTRLPAVDLDRFDDPWLATLRETYAGLHREVWVLDLTSDLGIPVMAALSRRTDKDTEDLVFGFGAHDDPRLALRRALTEMGQFLPAVAHVTPEGRGYAIEDPELMSWWTGATMRNQPYLMPDPAETPRGPGSFTYRPRADLRQDIAAAESLIRAHGMELLVLDQTRPDVELPVVKVIVPGLRHFWARFAPGRLFSVPVRLGHVDRPTRYEDINPIPLFV